MSLKGMIEPVTFTKSPQNPDYVAALAGPKDFIGDGCVYFAHQKPEGLAEYLRVDGTGMGPWSRAWMTFSLQLDGDDEDGYYYELEFECTPHHPESWVEWVTQDGTRELLRWAGLSRGEDDAERFMMENGIAPGQKFMAEILFTTSRDYWGEYDEHIDGHIMDIEPWTTEQILEAWYHHFQFLGGGPTWEKDDDGQ